MSNIVPEATSIMDAEAALTWQVQLADLLSGVYAKHWQHYARSCSSLVALHKGENETLYHPTLLSQTVGTTPPPMLSVSHMPTVGMYVCMNGHHI